MKILYITKMVRFGNDQKHTYIQGVYSTEADAVFSGKVEESWRAGKYTSIVEPFQLDAPIPVEELEFFLKCNSLVGKTIS